MGDPHMLIQALAGVAGLAIASIVFLKAWRGWLGLKQIELAGGHEDQMMRSPAPRVELADLKERIRRLEAIASGTDS